MRSTFYGLEIAKTGLFISQNQLDISGHNISNVDTPGYTRQRLGIASLPPAVGTSLIATDIKGTSGRGVTTICVEQIRNPFLDYQYRKENSITSSWTTKEQYFEYVEALFNNELDSIETSTGISAIFSGFYDSLYELQQKPEDKEIRVNVQQNAIVMTETLNRYYNDLVEQQDTLNESLRITVDEVNAIAKEIAQLNEQIYGFELSGARANDLRDQRNELLDTLSGLIDIETFEDTNGQLVVQIDGKNLVRHADYKQLATVANIDNPIDDGATKLYGIYWANSEGEPTTSKVEAQGGALKGYMDIRDGNSKDSIGIPYVIQQLNGLCQKIAQDMNEIHEKGYTIPHGDNAESRTGVDFFYVPVDENGEKDYSQITAQNFRISDDIMDDVYNIAASDMKVADGGTDNDQMGNGRIALEMCGLINKRDESGVDDSIDGKYKTILSAISVEMDRIHDTASGQLVMVNQVEQQRRSISDVSLDEEMTDVIRFGHAYNAASRVISAVDEQLDTLINKMGLVGRA
jgi:flagellar hook-associated protein 1 FlgK